MNKLAKTFPLFPLINRDAFFAPIDHIVDQMLNEMAGCFPDAVKGGTTARGYPKTDIYQDRDDLVFQCVVPFVNKEDLKVELTEDILTIGGEISKEEVEEDKEKKYYHKELRKSRFSRSFVVPKDLLDKHTDMEAVFREGVLSVRLKDAYKTELPPPPKTKLIEIK